MVEDKVEECCRVQGRLKMGSRRYSGEELQYEWKCIAAVVRKTAKRLSSYVLWTEERRRGDLVVEWGSTGKYSKEAVNKKVG